MSDQWVVLIPNLATGSKVGDTVTTEQLEAVGGNPDHLVKLGAVKAAPTTKKGDS